MVKPCIVTQAKRLRLLHTFGVGLLTCWLAIFAPMICEHHGLMLPSNPLMHVHHHHTTAGTPHSMQDDAQHMSAHEPASEVTLAMSILTLALPVGTAPAPDFLTTRIRIADALFPAEPDLPLPDEPPRGV